MHERCACRVGLVAPQRTQCIAWTVANPRGGELLWRTHTHTVGCPALVAWGTRRLPRPQRHASGVFSLATTPRHAHTHGPHSCTWPTPCAAHGRHRDTCNTPTTAPPAPRVARTPGGAFVLASTRARCPRTDQTRMLQVGSLCECQTRRSTVGGALDPCCGCTFSLGGVSLGQCRSPPEVRCPQPCPTTAPHCARR